MWYTVRRMANSRLSTRQSKTILVFLISMQSNSDRAKLQGIYDYATQHGWHVQVFTGPIDNAQYLRLIDDWRPAGCIIDGSLRKSDSFPPRVRSVKVVQLGNSYGIAPLRDNVSLDSRLVAETAAEVLLRHGENGFGYISAPSRPLWSVARGNQFAECVRRAGHDCAVLDTLSPSGGASNLTACVKFLSRLQKPANVMLASDNLAPLVYEAARKARLRIPEDLNIVSVDNDLSICTNLSPSLTSIEPDFRGGAYKAGERFGARASGVRKPLPRLTYGIASVAFRHSTTSARVVMHDVKAALDWINRHACGNIRVGDVVATMGYSRRRAEQLFFSSTGKTIGKAIEDARFDNVLVNIRRNTLSIGAIAARCGFSSSAYLATAFRRRHKTTITQWRQQRISNESKKTD